jgi:tetratricopeptide (TPR) repeat protein
MHRILLGLAFALVALPVGAESIEYYLELCGSDDDDVRISGCTSVIRAGTESAEVMSGAYAIRGSVYLKRGQLDLAISDYNYAITLGPDQGLNHYMRAVCYAHKGQREQAIADFRAELRITPGDEGSIEGLRKLGANP